MQSLVNAQHIMPNQDIVLKCDVEMQKIFSIIIYFNTNNFICLFFTQDTISLRLPQISQNLICTYSAPTKYAVWFLEITVQLKHILNYFCELVQKLVVGPVMLINPRYPIPAVERVSELTKKGSPRAA